MQGNLSQGQLPTNNEPVNSAAFQDSSNRITSTTDRRQHEKRAMKKSSQVCRFYNTRKGCRAQDQCPYLHVLNSDVPTSATVDQDGSKAKETSSSTTTLVNQNVQLSRAAQTLRDRAPVSKPIPSAQQKDPRGFQINQVVRRFSPQRDENSEGTVLKFKLQPSDPDFPFELEALECSLTVPVTYPKDGKPSIRVTNKDIPRGFQINVERGFDSLLSERSPRTLLQLLNDLDKHLEQFLTAEKAQTVKIVANRRPNDSFTRDVAIPEPISAAPSEVPRSAVPTSPAWTVQQKTEAKAKRDTEIRQLEARMSRVPLFAKSKDGVAFNVPLQVPKPTRLPLPLQSLKELTLLVPALYDLDPCCIKLKGVFGTEAENVELAFGKHASINKNMTLMSHINYLTQNIHIMAASTTTTADTATLTTNLIETSASSPTEANQPTNTDYAEIVDENRPHLRFISQPPPEWTRQRKGEESDSETSDEYDTSSNDSDVSDDLQSQAGGASVPLPTQSNALEKGVLLSFPQLELHGIELLELHNISISVKCDRCKETNDVKNIKTAEPNTNTIRTESCTKCTSPLSVSYRPEAMHINTIKAGYLDLEGCTVVDMLPSHFMPTCSECSTTFPSPGMIAVRGESPIGICRECHHRLNFKIPEIKFLRVSNNDPRLNLPLRSKRKKENLGITAGTELPERGRCKHYSKSYRWFRFSCCNRVYPCDRCHDEKEEHLNEHANRMICGWCSREQNYRPEDCQACGRSVIRKTGGGFWEGGKGTRDKAKMNRNDPRKYKRIGGTAKASEQRG